jgi:hypothetical protein
MSKAPMLASAMFRFLFAQDFEQWCDCHLSDRELSEIRSTPLVKIANSPLSSFLAMANIPTI